MNLGHCFSTCICILKLECNIQCNWEWPGMYIFIDEFKTHLRKGINFYSLFWLLNIPLKTFYRKSFKLPHLSWGLFSHICWGKICSLVPGTCNPKNLLILQSKNFLILQSLYSTEYYWDFPIIICQFLSGTCLQLYWELPINCQWSLKVFINNDERQGILPFAQILKIYEFFSLNPGSNRGVFLKPCQLVSNWWVFHLHLQLIRVCRVVPLSWHSGPNTNLTPN